MQSCVIARNRRFELSDWAFRRAPWLPAFLLLTALHGFPQSRDSETDGFTEQHVPKSDRATGGAVQFEAASIRPGTPDSKDFGNVDLDSSDYFRYQGGPVQLKGLLVNYIFFAYKFGDVVQYKSLSAQLPTWAQTHEFVVEARAPGNPTKDQIRSMVQALLADRFGLRMHTEVRQMAVYALVLEKAGKPGPGLNQHPDDQLCTAIPNNAAPAPKDEVPPFCGAISWPHNGLTHLRIMDWSLEQMGPELVRDGVWAGDLDPRPVLDRTGLKGKWDLNIEFLRSKRDPAAADSEAATPAPDFLDALQRDAGLKLVKETGPVVTYLVDAVHPPSEN